MVACGCLWLLVVACVCVWLLVVACDCVWLWACGAVGVSHGFAPSPRYAGISKKFIGGNGALVFGSDHVLIALDPIAGGLLWSFESGLNNANVSGSAPTVGDGKLFRPVLPRAPPPQSHFNLSCLSLILLLPVLCFLPASKQPCQMVRFTGAVPMATCTPSAPMETWWYVSALPPPPAACLFVLLLHSTR